MALARFTALPPIMPITGVAMASMLLWGKRMSMAVPAAVLVARSIVPAPVPFAFQILVTISLTLGSVIGVLVVERMVGPHQRPAKAEHALPIILGATICSLLIAVCMGVPVALHHGLGAVRSAWTCSTAASASLPALCRRFH